MYFLPRKNPNSEPIVEPKTVAMIARYTLMPATIPAPRATIGDIICGIKSRKIETTRRAGTP